jgi:hypothetical protein
MRTYEVRLYPKNVGGYEEIHARFSAPCKADALAKIAADEAMFLPLEASRLYRLANKEDGPEKTIRIFPAVGDLTQGGIRTGLLSEDEDF